MDQVAEELKSRTKRFALAILEFVETLPTTPGGIAVARQLSRSGIGVVGNYRSACRSRSHGEFTSRTAVVLDECDESELWIDIAGERRWGDPVKQSWLARESGELRAIFSQAYQTARARERKRR